MLRLPADRAPEGATLQDHLAGRAGPVAVIRAFAAALPGIAARLAAGRLYGDPAATVGINDSGDKQKAMDVAAHHYVLGLLKDAGVARVLSEEADEVTELDPQGAWDVAMDPIDGSGSIGIGAPLGLFFAVFPAGAGFLRSGREIVAAGYASFGHSLDYGFSLGDGVDLFAHDPADGAFRLTRAGVRLKPQASTIAYNASNERHWEPGLQAWARDLRAGKDGPRGRDFNMRWLAAAAGELHRILLEGGAFLYPSDLRKGYARGRLRTLYEAFPIAFLIEQAGGRATDGRSRILDRLPEALHEHTPLVFGAADEVEQVARYLA
ncbi:class 1 fructose-bisphosphatase [Pseudogemmobacter humi]|uniref:Fructose-1,6-bisphosphatase class 1 n=1 Tax=Pseudogemmobacter humi TaxID=2483812 RepID=A0A3P5WHN7_9RHOB|nr:class 1 fructose-bisphosphatase [Pseudogemmobacter humi]VDC21188.1 Fructose-1,6-bisphosphatase class 1 [Pseudogemmobacter humi]